jgi:hypothetical protein
MPIALVVAIGYTPFTEKTESWHAARKQASVALGAFMKRCHHRLGDMHCREEGSVVWGALEEGVTTNLYECDLVSWSREATSLWHGEDNSWCVGLQRGSLTTDWHTGLVR